MIRIAITLCLCAGLLAREAFGGGIELNLNGHRQLAMGHTGTGLALDAATIFFNPAGLAFIDSRDIQFGVSVVMPQTSYLAETPNIYQADMHANLLYTPAYFYFSWRLQNSRFSWGLGANSPFWFESKWEDDWKGRFISQEFAVTTLFIQPTLSYKINNQLSIGAGVVYAFGNTFMRKALPINSIADQDAEGAAELSGKADGFGFNLGLYYRPNDTFSVGFTYRSGYQMEIVAGEAKFEVPSSLVDFFPQTTYTSSLSLPAIWSLGWSYQPKEDFRLAFDINYAGWKKLDTLGIDYADNTLRLHDSKMAKNFRNSMSFRIGGEYIAHEHIRVRAGLWYDTTPVTDNFVSPEFPDANRIGLTLGIGAVLFKQLTADLVYQYAFTGERTAFFREAGFGGTYKSTLSVLGLGIRYTY